MPSTYEQFKGLSASEKVGLVRLEASRRLMGWVLYSGSIYSLENFDVSVIATIEENGTALTEVSSIATVTAGKFYNDTENNVLYLRTSGSVNPNSRFIALTERLFFSNVGVKAPHDLSTGFDVYWRPLLRNTSDFGVELDNQNFLGFALEGSGSISFVNEKSYWQPRFDKLYFENKKVQVYSWHREMPITEAKLIYVGRIQEKRYSREAISFTLKDSFNQLRAPVDLDDLSDRVGARVTPKFETAKQRLVYGIVSGLRPQNIDQVLPLSGYPLTGTITATADSATVTGSGTAFLSELSPDDQILLAGSTVKSTIKSIASNTSLTLTEGYDDVSASAVAGAVFPDRPIRYANRVFLIAGHAIRQPIAEITLVISLTAFQVDDATDFFPGDSVLIGSEVFVIERISGNTITTRTAAAASPNIGDTITNIVVRNVYLNDRLLTYSRDYTYDADEGTITLDDLAEFNVAPVRALITGTIAFTNTSRTITGTNTTFKSDLQPGYWVRRAGESAWFEILSIESDTSATLRTAATYTLSGAADFKSPDVYQENQVVLSCETFGATSDGTSDGALIYKAADIVKDLLTRAGLADSLNAASFVTAAAASDHRLGIAIPKSYITNKSQTLRDAINSINQSVFGALFQNEDFELEYSILRPTRPEDLIRLDQYDAVKFVITANSANITKTVKLSYLPKEYDPESADESEALYYKVSDNAQYLAKTEKEFAVETLLIDEDSARVFSNRWSFLLELASSLVNIQTKLKTMDVSVNDRVLLSHPELYERVGSQDKRKIAAVSESRKSVFDSTVSLDDLSNAFSRCAIITENDASEWSAATDDEKLFNGYITDTYGMQDNDPETFGVNLIW